MNPVTDQGLAFMREFFRSRSTAIVIERETRLTDAIDSLLFIDLFYHVEKRFGTGVSLDEISQCETFGEVADILNRFAD